MVPLENTGGDEDSDTSYDSSTSQESVVISTDVPSLVSSEDLDFLAAECENLKRELEETRAKLKATEFQIDVLSHDDKKLNY